MSKIRIVEVGICNAGDSTTLVGTILVGTNCTIFVGTKCYYWY